MSTNMYGVPVPRMVQGPTVTGQHQSETIPTAGFKPEAVSSTTNTAFRDRITTPDSNSV